MRISSGFLRGKKILFQFIIPPKPSEGKVKEALMSMTREALPGSVFLDLFAGSGAVGLEAYSNGAGEVYFVESDLKLASSLKKNIDLWRVTGKVMRGDYRRFLDFFHRKEITFDIVYIDPPYLRFSYVKILNALQPKALLNPKGWVIIERHYKSLTLTEEDMDNHSLTLFRERKYGSVCMDVYRYRLK